MRYVLILLLCASPTLADDAETIRNHILKGAEAFMNNDPEGILAHYAKDIVLSYPGIPDMRYDDLVKIYEQVRHRKAKVQTTPTFEEILVDGNWAVVRLRWNTVTTEDGQTSSREMKDLQVWRRDKDGQWRFARGMHYRQPK